MSPIVQNNHHNNTITYYNNNAQHYQVSPSFSSASSITSSTSSSSVVSSAARLGQIRAQLELARNFYDDFEFCPVQCSTEVLEHRDRIQQRLSPQSSPNASPNMSYAATTNKRSYQNISPKSRRAIPIINPSNMAPVSVPASQQQYFYKHNNNNGRTQHSYYDVLVQ